MTENNNKFYNVNFNFDDNFKAFAKSYSNVANDPFNEYSLYKLHYYDYFHNKLKTYFENNNIKNAPTKTDNFAFLILISYPDYKIAEFDSIKCIKLFNSNSKNKNKDLDLDLDLEKTDFEYVGSVESNEYESDDNITLYNCICSQKLMNVYFLKNRYSNITFNVGCDCIKCYGLISKNDPNYIIYVMRKNERKKEKAEGLAEGYYENQRAIRCIESNKKKEKKLELDNEKTERRCMKEEDAIRKEFYKYLNKNKYKDANCYLCKKHVIYDQTVRHVKICGSCVSQTKYEKKLLCIKNIKYNNPIKSCINCNILTFQSDLCLVCKTSFQIIDCIDCLDAVVLDINDNEERCSDCKKNIINCIICDIVIYKTNDWKKKCTDCFKESIKNKNITNKCQVCNESFQVSESDKWKDKCNRCFKDSIKNKNKILTNQCEVCKHSFQIDESEKKWKKKCYKCFIKSIK